MRARASPAAVGFIIGVDDAGITHVSELGDGAPSTTGEHIMLNVKRRRSRLRRAVLAALVGGFSGGLAAPEIGNAQLSPTMTITKEIVDGSFPGDPTTFDVNLDCSSFVLDTTVSVTEPIVVDIPQTGSCQINEAVSAAFTTTYHPLQSIEFGGTDVSVIIRNTRRRSTLRIVKQFVGGGPAPGEQFLVDWACTTPTATFNGTVTFTGPGTQVAGVAPSNTLPAEATCTVTERSVAGYTPTYSPSQTIALGPSNVTVTVVNTKLASPQRSLVVTKEVIGTYGGETFDISYDCELNAVSVADGILHFAGAGQQEVTGISEGAVCSLAEAPVPGYLATYSPASQQVTIPVGDVAEFVVRNTRSVGSLRVAKRVVDETGETFVINVECRSTAGDVVFNGSFVTATAGVRLFTDIPAPSLCTVTEQPQIRYNISYDFGQFIVVSAGGTSTLMVTNTRLLGSFEIEKTVVGGDGTFSFNWVCVVGTWSRTGRADITTSGGTAVPAVVPSIPTDATCTVTEVDDPLYNSTVSPAGGQVVITSTPQAVSFVNQLKGADLRVTKFYDANVNGVQDLGEPSIPWRVTVDTSTYDIPTANPISLLLGAHTVSEASAPGWVATTPTTQLIVLTGPATVTFGNVCLGAGGARSKGYWSNAGKSRIVSADLAVLRALPFVGADGQPFDPINANQVSSFLKSAEAANMAHMLSAQLVAMMLNLRHGGVSATANVFDDTAFVTIGSLVALALDALAADGLTPSGDPNRTVQELVKDRLDDANNNSTFVQPVPCVSPF